MRAGSARGFHTAFVERFESVHRYHARFVQWEGRCLTSSRRRFDSFSAYHGDDVNVGFSQRFAKPSGFRAPGVRLSPSPPCAGDPNGKGSGCNPDIREFDSRPALHAPKVFKAACLTASQRGRVRIPVGALTHRWPIG